MDAPITGLAAGVPFTALPPSQPIEGPAPLVIVWHMMDAPRTDAAFAAALPLAGVPAWRVYLGLPWTGRRTFEGGRAEAARDPILRYLDPVVRQAADEFPPALASVREQVPVDQGPIAVVGGSLGGAVALRVLVRNEVPITAAALVNPAIRARSVLELFTASLPYAWTDESRAAADALDFVALAPAIAARHPQAPLLVVSGALDHPAFRADAGELVDTLRGQYLDPGQVEWTTVAGLAHPLAEEPGLEPAPQLPPTRLVDEAVTAWLVASLVR